MRCWKHIFAKQNWKQFDATRQRYASSDKNHLRPQKKGDRWGLNPQPLEPQSRALPVELRSPRFERTASIVDSSGFVKSFFLRSTHNSPHCHPERSEGSLAGAGQILRSAQDDSHTKGNTSGVRPHL